MTGAAESPSTAEAVGALLQRRAAYHARAGERRDRELLSLIRMRRGRSRFAVVIERLREVRPLQGFRRIPGASPRTPGLFHFRGDILSLHDLAAIFGPPPPTPPEVWAAIIDHPLGDFALLADDVEASSQVPVDELEPPPVTLGDAGRIVSALLPSGELVIDVDALRADASLFDAFPKAR